MKKINSWKDISIKWDDAKERFIVNLRPLGIKPSRPAFKTKTEAVSSAQSAYQTYLDPSYTGLGNTEDEPCGISLSDALKMYLKDAELRANDVDENNWDGLQ
tara:strand:+ start:213 stop:518 length:306 start_codon:yes stop_codon:yes gene_type:complete